jgi:hypothetical protein
MPLQTTHHDRLHKFDKFTQFLPNLMRMRQAIPPSQEADIARTARPNGEAEEAGNGKTRPILRMEITARCEKTEERKGALGGTGLKLT